jgi:diketogulonate reductase-like aldo/keto reductase
MMKAAWDRGINTFDTANMYSNGASEEIVAKFIEKVCLLSLFYRSHILTADFFLSSLRHEHRTKSPVTRSSS